MKIPKWPDSLNPMASISKLTSLVGTSVRDNSNVSSLRIQAYWAFGCVYGFWFIANVAILWVAISTYIATPAATRGKFDFSILGWLEIISLTGGMILGRVWQSQNEIKKVG